MRQLAVAAFGLMLCSGIAFGQDKSADCAKGAPAKIEGKVVAVNAEQGKLSVQGGDGKTHEFQLTKEAVQQYKVGDAIDAKLRC
ncbi:MAG: hypothetical protein H0V78_05305 [Burkholderiales bacterium]|nr:hypothetical protein [Burkholderiales bacterium]